MQATEERQIAEAGSALQKLWEYGEEAYTYGPDFRFFHPKSPSGNGLVLAALKQCKPTSDYRPEHNNGAPREKRTYEAPSGAVVVCTFHSRGHHGGRRYVESVGVQAPKV